MLCRCSSIRDTTTEVEYVKFSIVKVSSTERLLCSAASLFRVPFSAKSEVFVVYDLCTNSCYNLTSDCFIQCISKSQCCFTAVVCIGEHVVIVEL